MEGGGEPTVQVSGQGLSLLSIVWQIPCAFCSINNPFLDTHFFHSVYSISLEELNCCVHVVSESCSGGTAVVYM